MSAEIEKQEDVGAASPSPAQKAGDAMLEFGVGVDNGKVVIKFNTQINWFDLAPDVAVAFAEAVINCAMKANAENAEAARKIATPNLPGLIVPSTPPLVLVKR